MFKKISSHILLEITNHPKIASILGAIEVFLLGMIDIETTTVWLKFFGELFKTLGIIPGAAVAIYGFIKTFFPNLIKKKDNGVK